MAEVARPLVLVVEDEPAIAELIEVNLRHHGVQVQLAYDAVAAQAALDAVLPDAVVLDWMLPGQSGESLLRRWRRDERTCRLPVLMLTARVDETDKVQGLEAGADDYITKPFSPRELVARIRAVLRRSLPAGPDESLMLGDLRLDAATHRVSHAGQAVKLGPTEFKLLHHLMSRPERVHSRASLLDQVWGDAACIEERTVDVHIKRLRQALGEAGSMIETVRGAGYRITHTQGSAA